MNTLTLRNNKFFFYLNNMKSENLGFYFSFIFHFVILLFAIGMPNFFAKSPIYIPNIIPVEIINVTDVTSIPEKIEKDTKENLKKNTQKKTEVKKFNNSEIQEIKKIDIKRKTKS